MDNKDIFVDDELNNEYVNNQSDSEKINTIFDSTTQIDNVDLSSNNEVETTVSSSQDAVEDNVKQPKKRWPVILIIILVLIMLGLIGYIYYDKSNKNDTSKEASKEEKKVTKSTDIEYATLDFETFKGYLKLGTDGIYELRLGEVNTMGKYIKRENVYLLEDDVQAKVNGNYIEITGVKKEGFVFYNYILYKKNKIDNIKAKIKNSIMTYIDEISKKQTSASEIENVKINFGECFKYALNDEDINKNVSKNISCNVGYKIYFRDYKSEECNIKYSDYIGSSGTCNLETVDNSFYILFDENSNYKILQTYTGM